MKNKFHAGWAAGKGQRVSHSVIGIYPLEKYKYLHQIV